MRRNNPESKQPGRHRTRGLLLNLLIIVCIYFAVQWYQARPLASGNAPELRAQTTGARSFDLSDWRGQPVLVHFWAIWCRICTLEQNSIEALSADHRVITIAMQSGDDLAIHRYLQQQGLSFDTIADPYGEIATEWGVRGVPASFVLDGGGRIRFAEIGYSTGIGLRGKLWAAEQLH